MKKLTKKRLDNLGSILAFLEVNQFEDSDLYAGCDTETKVKDIDDTLEWLDDFYKRELIKRKKRENLK